MSHEPEGPLGGPLRPIAPTDLDVLSEAGPAANGEESALPLQLAELRLLQSVLDGLGDALLVFDAQGRVVRSNPAAAQLLGHDPCGDALDSWDERYAIFRPDRQTPYGSGERPIARSLAGEDVDTDDLFVVDKDSGLELWLHVTARPIRDEKGEVRGAFAVLRDVTRRRSAESTMRFLVHAVASSHEGITITERSDKGERIIYANEGFAKLTGYERSEIRGRDWSFLQGPNTNPEHLEALGKAIGKGSTATVEILNYRKNGAPFWNRVSVTPVPEVGSQGRYFVAVHSDVTAAKRNEDRLRAAHNKLRQANARMRQNLKAAAQVQQALLPLDLPEYAWGKVAWRFRPCDELAGDNLSVFELDDDHIAFYVLDVCGHGVAAALLSVTVRRFLSPTVASSSMMLRRGVVWSSRIVPPAKVADQLNERFAWDADHGQFFTLFYGVLNTKTGQLRYVLAGHPRPVLVTGGRVRELPGRGFPIGLCPDAYEEEEITLGAGDRILAYSDGLTEVMNLQRKSFGEDRLFNALYQTAVEPLDEALDGVLERADAWRGNARLRDDITLAAIEMNRTPESRWSW